MSREKISFRQELPLLIWLVLLWAALWQNFSLGTILLGIVIALVVTRVFYLPPVQLTGRFNLGWAMLFMLVFLWEVAKASVTVAYLAIFKGPRIQNAVIAVPLRSHDDDLLLTATSQVTALIPGSLVIDVDRANAILYLHSLNINSEQDAAAVRQHTRNVEAWIIRVLGSKKDYAALKAETQKSVSHG